MSQTEFAWAAGFIDGEGHLGIHYRLSTKRRWVYHIGDAQLSVTNTSSESLVALQKVFGGLGTILPAYTRPRHKPIFRWAICRMIDIARVLLAILPYVVTKRRQTELLLAYCASRISRRGKRHPISEIELSMIRELKALNKRGI